MVSEHISNAIDELEEAHSKSDGMGTSMMLQEMMNRLESIQQGYNDSSNDE